MGVASNSEFSPLSSSEPADAPVVASNPPRVALPSRKSAAEGGAASIGVTVAPPQPTKPPAIQKWKAIVRLAKRGPIIVLVLGNERQSKPRARNGLVAVTAVRI
jgi:hypothetical protein